MCVYLCIYTYLYVFSILIVLPNGPMPYNCVRVYWKCLLQPVAACASLLQIFLLFKKERNRLLNSYFWRKWLSRRDTKVCEELTWKIRHKGLFGESVLWGCEGHTARASRRWRFGPFSCILACGCAGWRCVRMCWSVLKCVGVCCSVLQCVAVCCSALECVGVRCSVLCCSVLQ